MPTLFCMKSGARSHASLCTAGSAFGHDKYENVQCPAFPATIYMATSHEVDVVASICTPHLRDLKPSTAVPTMPIRGPGTGSAEGQSCVVAAQSR